MPLFVGGCEMSEKEVKRPGPGREQARENTKYC